LKDYENKLWDSLNRLIYVLFGTNSHDLMYFTESLLLQNQYEQTDGHGHNYEIDSQYKDDVADSFFVENTWQ